MLMHPQKNIKYIQVRNQYRNTVTDRFDRTLEAETETNTTTIKQTFLRNTEIVGVIKYENSSRPISGDFTSLTKNIRASHSKYYLGGLFDLQFDYETVEQTQQQMQDSIFTSVDFEHTKVRYEASYGRFLSRHLAINLRASRTERTINEHMYLTNRYEGNVYYRLRKLVYGWSVYTLD